MRYEFVGRKTKNVGKTLWEIVGNLKNFGIGRLIKTVSLDLQPKICYFKILKVQPVPPKKNEFENREVLVWVEDIFNGYKKLRLLKKTYHTKYQLIPKIEERKYLDVKLEPPVKYVSKYCSWPPLYKKIWEQQNQGTALPKLKNINEECEGFKIIENEMLEENKSSLYKGELSVHEMYLEIVRLKTLIKEHNESQK